MPQVFPDPRESRGNQESHVAERKVCYGASLRVGEVEGGREMEN